MSLDFWIGLFLGLSIGAWASIWMMRRYIRNKVALRRLIAEMYHKDLLPEICRAEGLINLATREHHHLYAAMALKEIQNHKQKILALIKKYHEYQ